MPVRPGGAEDPAERIERLVRGTAPAIRRAFEQAIRLIEDARTLDQIADLLAQGRFEEALSEVEAAALLLANQYGTSLNRAAQAAAEFLTESVLTVAISYDVTNESAVAAARENQLRLVTSFTQQQRETTRLAITEGIAGGLNPRDQARAFRDSIGLTPSQMRAVSNFRRLLAAGTLGQPSAEALTRALRDRRFDRSVRRAIRDGQALSQEQIDKMVERYRQRYIKYRSEVIARTEALRAVHEGTDAMYQQAIDAGEFTAEQLRRRWVTAADERVRGSHRSLDGQERPKGQSWTSGNGFSLRFPGDPQAPASETVQCRCVISTRIQEGELPALPSRPPFRP